MPSRKRLFSIAFFLLHFFVILTKSAEVLPYAVFEYKAQGIGHRLVNSFVKEKAGLSAMDCTQECLKEGCHCKSVNYGFSSKKCQLNSQIAFKNGSNLDRDKEFTYIEKKKDEYCQAKPKDTNECLSSPCHQNASCNNTIASFTCTCNKGFEGDGNNCTAMHVSGKTCEDIVSKHKNSWSGNYWIRPEGPSNKSFRVYCDMDTFGGGWTLVYSYTFTNYSNFNSSSNAVTPRPNWPASSANVPISTTPPLNESSRGAIDYNLWKYIGKEFMIKSNINDWIVCQNVIGSLVNKSDGDLSCKNIKNIVPKCQGVAPKSIKWLNIGPALKASNWFHDFVGSVSRDWPTHDPCGKRKPNQKQGVQNPGGVIYLR